MLIGGTVVNNKSIRRLMHLVGLLILVSSTPWAHGEGSETAEDWAALVGNRYRIHSNVTYKVANGYEARLDVYNPRNTKSPQPAVIYIHGGGWTGGAKEAVALRLMPYLEMGLAVVNVEYRLARVSLAPAAVQDCRCALQWVIRNAEKYKFDTSRLVVTGGSAGGHLSLMTGILDPSAGLDDECPGDEKLEVAAIVNFYGITDVADLLDGPHRQRYAVAWLGGMENREAVARRVSPLTYLREGLPPILTIHGDADTIVPYVHAIRMHKELDKNHVSNQLLTVPGGGHGGFSKEQTLEINRTIRAFFKKHGIL